MFNFIFKAFMRDKNRSLIPTIVVSIGVFLTVSMTGFIRGTMGDMVDITAKFQTGHVKVMTRAYAANSEQMPNDLCLLEVDALKGKLSEAYPSYVWEERILFGGLVDISDTEGNTLKQGSSSVMSIDLSADSREVKRLNIQESIETGCIPEIGGEVLLGYLFADKLEAEVGDTINFSGITMHGKMNTASYIVSGTVRFGNPMMDRSTLMMDIRDAQEVMDMENGASMLLGFHQDEVYFDNEAIKMSQEFNDAFTSENDELTPTMIALRAQNGMDGILTQTESFTGTLIFLFIIVMSIVLWNTGLIAGLRRYQEFGIRLALGETKRHIYWSLVGEAVIVGSLGSIMGTMIALASVYYLQTFGIDISGMMPEDASMMMPNIMRAKLTPDLLYLGFIPGVLATTLGALLSGRGIYKRETSRLMKEMEI